METHMTKYLIATALFLAMLIPAHAQDDAAYRNRQMADNEYDSAQKAYRNAVAKYGENMEGLPDDEKESACKKIGWALNDNKYQLSVADPFTLTKYKRQVDDLNKFNTAFGCEK
jgi:hypothetical protein